MIGFEVCLHGGRWHFENISCSNLDGMLQQNHLQITDTCSLCTTSAFTAAVLGINITESL